MKFVILAVPYMRRRDEQVEGIVPPPPQNEPHPPVYTPFSYSMETARFWATS